jgi:hypothetical protein
VRKVFESSMVRLRPVSVFTKVGPGTLTGPERVRDAERTHQYSAILGIRWT